MSLKISQLTNGEPLQANDLIPIARDTDNKYIRGVFFKTKRHIVIDNNSYAIGSHNLIDQILLIDPAVTQVDLTPSSVKPGIVISLVNFLGAYGAGSVPSTTSLQLGTNNFVLWLDGTCTNVWDRQSLSVDILFIDPLAASSIQGFTNTPLYVQVR